MPPRTIKQSVVDPVQISLAHPSLEYWRAFDLCAMAAHRNTRVLVLASEPFYARELLKRLAGTDVTFVPLDSDWLSAAKDPTTLLGIEVQAPVPYSLPALNIPYPTIIWAEPTRQNSQQTIAAITRLLEADGLLCVISTGSLGWFLKQKQVTKQPLGQQQTIQLLKKNHYMCKEHYGFHGPLSIFWSFAYRALVRLNRDDLADRYIQQMRMQYASRQTRLTTLNVSIVYKKTSAIELSKPPAVSKN